MMPYFLPPDKSRVTWSICALIGVICLHAGLGAGLVVMRSGASLFSFHLSCQSKACIQCFVWKFRNRINQQNVTKLFKVGGDTLGLNNVFCFISSLCVSNLVPFFQYQYLCVNLCRSENTLNSRDSC